GTQNALISIDENGKIQRYEKKDNIPGKKITALYKLDETSMYVGGSEGVSYYTNGTFTLMGSRDAEFIGTVRDIEIVNGRIYCASNLGLFVYRDSNFYVAHGVNQVLYNLELDENGKLWFGTEEGLFYLSNGEIQKAELLEDPGSNFINFLNYRNGELFVGTDNGLFVLSELDKGKFKMHRFGISDGILDLETNLNSGFFDLDGDFWFGTASGLVCYQQNLSKLKVSSTIVNLKSILLNYQPFDYSTYSRELSENGLPSKLILPYSKNNLIFNLDGVSLVNYRGLKYQFWLEGMHDSWSPLTGVSTITFTSIPAGDYVLKMRAVDMDGRMSAVIDLPFEIKEAYYKTWWFMLLCGMILASIIWLIFRFRVNRINELNEKEKLVFKTRLLSLEQQSVNASMNRHFIFNALNSIQYFINTQDRLSANKYLTNFAQLIRKNLDSATAEHNTITLEEELSRIKLYLSLESMRFNDRFDYEIRTDAIDLESISIPAMIMQPFIENSIIHGILPNENKKGHILIALEIEDDYLNIIIEDNGIGVNQSLSSKGGFDGDHRSQGMEITSKRIELIRKLTNKQMALIGPDEMLNDDRSIKGTRVLIKIPL
ncbi:MAG: histidine kinase, partial [Crocinitomicaceae bacterium]|nr:histidine kinase [Crocinitomicaceae bacterium]